MYVVKRMIKKTIKNLERETELNIYEGPSNKVLIICHGASEGALRYIKMAEYFKQYFTVITYNHPSHETGAAVDFTYDQIVEDTAAVISYAQKEYETVSIFAHSMGSLVVRNNLSYIKDDTKLILSGAPVLSFSETVQLYGLSLILKYSDKDLVSDKWNYKMFDEKNAKAGLENKSWISSKQYIVDIYKQSKLSNQKFTNRSLLALVELTLNSCGKDVNRKLKKYELMLVSGARDVFTHDGAGYDKIKKQCTNAQVNIYQNSYHEVHNDIDSEQLFDDILKFIEKDANGKN